MFLVSRLAAAIARLRQAQEERAYLRAVQATLTEWDDPADDVLLPPEPGRRSLADILKRGPFADLDLKLERAEDRGRDVEL